LIRIIPAEGKASNIPFAFARGFFYNEPEMKTSRRTTNKQSKQGKSKKPRPEIRDDLDSRQSRELGYRGDISKKGDRKKKTTI
jgi:hypothetical protein